MAQNYFYSSIYNHRRRCEKVIDLYCSEFKDISKNWTGINDSATILPRSHGGKAPGHN